MSLKKEMWDSNEKTCDDSNQPILVVDLIRSILERLSFVDFHRARCISSLWYTASESCIGGPSTPWIILFPNEFVERNNDSYYNNDFHVLNLFTRERIPLPSLESTDGFPMNITNRLDTAVLWVDEKSRDYLVAWSYGDIFAYRKNGDGNNSWKVIEPLKNQRCVDMVCKESKLYVFSDTRVTVFDFSRSDSPMECAILVIASRVEPHPGTFLFFVYKLDPKSSKWSIIKSIGDEALILDLGIIVAAKDGVMKIAYI
ncbi:putative galactose oxidase/kelch, beta-propeller [Arabidopsis thaliana]